MDSAIKLISALVRAGWSVNVMHEIDTGDNPFVTVEAVKDTNHMRVVWHTRGFNGKYRLHSCTVKTSKSMYESTLKDAHAFITDGGETDE